MDTQNPSTPARSGWAAEPPSQIFPGAVASWEGVREVGPASQHRASGVETWWATVDQIERPVIDSRPCR
jgi:hypothetical protein